MISSGLWRIGTGMTNPFWVLYVLQLGGSYLHIGLITAVSSIFSIIPLFFGGYLADTLGRKRMVNSMSILMSLDRLLFAFAPSWEWLLIGKAIDSILMGFRQPAFNALIADSTNIENRALQYSMWQTIPPFFGILSPFIAGILIDNKGILIAQRWSYIIYSIVAIIGSLMRVRFLRETLIPDQTRPRTTVTSIIRETLKEFKDTVRNLTRNIWLLFLIGGLFQFGASAGTIFMITYATQDVIHLTSANWGLITTASMIMSMFSLPFGVLADRYGRRRLVIVSLSLTPLMVLGFVYSRSFMYVFVFAVVLAFLSKIGSLASQALFIDYTPREHRGRINALTSIIGASQNLDLQRAAQSTVIGAVGNLVGGFLYVNVSYASPFFLMIGMVLLTLSIIIVWIKEPVTREE